MTIDFYFVYCHWDEDVGLFESLQQDKIAFAAVVQFQNMRGNGMRVILVQILIQWPWTDCHNQTINWTTFLVLMKWYFKPTSLSLQYFSSTVDFSSNRLFLIWTIVFVSTQFSHFVIACKYVISNHNYPRNNQQKNNKAWKWQSFL